MITLLVLMNIIATVPSLLKAQHEFVTTDHPNPVLIAGLGFGKTYSIPVRFSKLWTDLIRDGEKEPFLLSVGLTSSHNKTVIRPAFEAFFNHYNLDWKYSPANDEKWYKIRFNGATVTIKILSAHNPEMIVGFNAHHANIDELDVLPYHKARLVYENVSDRVRIGKNPTLSATTTAEGYKFAYWLCVTSAFLDTEGNEKKDESGNKITTAPLAKYIQGKTKDNPHLSAEYITKLKKMYDTRRFKAYTEGIFLNFARGQVFEFFNDDMIVELDKNRVYGSHYTFWDFGWNNPTYVGFAIIDDNHNIYIYDEIVRRKTVLQDIIKEAKAIRPNNAIFDYCDPAGKQHDQSSGDTDIMIMRANDLNPKYMASRIPPRIRIINNLLEKGKIKVHPKCKHMINSFRNTVYPEPVNGVYDERPLKDGIHDHASDAFGYLAINHFHYEVQEWQV